MNLRNILIFREKFIEVTFSEMFLLFFYIHRLRKFYFTSNLVLWKELEKEPMGRKVKKELKILILSNYGDM